jgi:hypothetical protein
MEKEAQEFTALYKALLKENGIVEQPVSQPTLGE